MKIIPLRDRILIKRVGEEKKTKGGIITPDAAKVVRLGLQNAASIAGLLLTANCVVTEKPKKKKTSEMPEEY
jgi:chaperonin GroEL (HSP60 family)